MIDPKELRIGNLVNYKYIRSAPDELVYGEASILAIHENGFQFKKITGAPSLITDLGNFNPIPITPEWLERFGFEKIISPKGHENWVLYSLHHLAFVLSEITHFIGFTYYSYGTDHSLELKFVHQLQNLYFALTGHELTVKELTPAL